MAEARSNPSTVRMLLERTDTRIVVWIDGQFPVVGPAGTGPTRLATRTAVDGDTAEHALLLGRDSSGAAWLAFPFGSAGEPLADEAGGGAAARLRTSAGAELPAGAHGGGLSPTSTEVARRMSQGFPSDVQWRGLRDVGPGLPEPELEIAMATQALARWHASHPRCPRCGTPTRAVQSGWVRRCPEDDSEHYPRSDPAVIMAVTDPRDRLLLARSPQWPPSRMSVLAGFVEPGERLEEAVAREVREEVGLRVFDVRYSGSQPWPFPASIMLGYTARSQGSGLHIDPTEIAEAQWFSRGDLVRHVSSGAVMIPGRLSIARRLVEGWLGEALHPPVESAFGRG